MFREDELIHRASHKYFYYSVRLPVCEIKLEDADVDIVLWQDQAEG